MPDNSNQVFLIKGEALHPMPERQLKEGLFEKTLEDALQTLIAKHPEVIHLEKPLSPYMRNLEMGRR